MRQGYSRYLPFYRTVVICDRTEVCGSSLCHFVDLFVLISCRSFLFNIFYLSVAVFFCSFFSLNKFDVSLAVFVKRILQIFYYIWRKKIWILFSYYVVGEFFIGVTYSIKH